MHRFARPSASGRILSVSLCFVLLITTAPTSGASANRAASPAAGTTVRVERAAESRPGQLLVRFREDAPEQARETVARARGARRRGSLRGGSGVEVLELAAGHAPAAAAAVLGREPAVEYAEPNYVVRGEQAAAPADPLFAEQWALKNTGQRGGTQGSDVGAEAAWRKATGSRQTVVAVIDSGIDFSHPDLANNAWTNPRERANDRDDDRNGFVDDLAGWDWVAQNGNVADPNGHGTAVAGIIAAEGDNLTGTAGVMWRASLMSLRVLDETGTGDVAAAVEAIDYAVAHGASVINLSWGTDGESRVLRDAILRAGRRGVLVVCSAGNTGRGIDAEAYYPASYDLPNLLSVAATDNSDRKASWSNWGARSVGVAAPGADILTTQPGGGYRVVSGTSAAAPHVAGVAGLVKSLYPALGAEGVRTAIIRGVRRVAWLDGAVFSGGVVAAAGALDAVGALPVGGAGGGNGGGNAGGQGDGQGNGNGQGGAGNGNGWHGQSPRPGAPGRGSGGRGPGGSFDVEPPAPYMQAPPGFGNHDEIRRGRGRAPRAASPISANTALPVCDVDCAGAEPPAGGAGGSDPYFGNVRTNLENETGQPGVDLGSRNFNWGMPLVSLAGRAGLDLSVGLYYNSLVWTRQDRTVQFNGDHGFPGPGFRLGFPTLQFFFSFETGLHSYVLITPSGGRVEMPRVSNGVYESADGTYTQLTQGGGGTIVRTTDGTQLRFVYNSMQDEYRCVEIKDRNGNYITVNYDQSTTPGQYGRPTSVIDTLGRTLTFNYDDKHYLTSITQSWKRDTQTGQVTQQFAWARFGYDTITIQTNFADEAGPLTVVGPANGTSIPVLKRVWLPDDTYFEFEYTSWGQVNRINRRSPAPTNWLLARTAYGLSSDTSSVQSDCPRVTERREWASWANGDTGDHEVGPGPEEAVTTYAVASDDSWTQVTPPDPTPGDASDNVVYKEFFHTSGWQKGLTSRTEVWAGGALKKWTTVGWTQDDPNLWYALNPRPAETVVADIDGNRRRTAIAYTSYGLPENVREYTGPENAETLRRRTFTEYRWDAAWIDRRIIGLVARQQVYEGESALVSKVEYGYDWDSVGFSFYDTPAPAAQHDRTNYGPSFIYGRGNLTFIARYDVTDPNNQSKMSETKMGVNVTGSLVMSQDHDWHRVRYDYDGQFTDGSTHNAFAFPTKVTDPDGHYSTAEYNYDMGVIFRSVDPKGAERKTFYDAQGRPERTESLPGGSYTTYAYNPDYGHLITNTAVEANRGLSYTNTIVDGRGQVRLFVANHPNSTGGYLAVRYRYDALGRLTEQSNPTEIHDNGNPAGDDALYRVTLQQYDWQGRPTVTTYPTGNTVEVTYGGCGCAGGEVTTVRDERGRRKKYTKDVLGRLAKVEELNWDQSVYSTTDYTYNARDQITGINQAGQLRTFEYDGHGRLWKRTTPEQGTVEYAYNRDDTVWWAKDARGAKTVFGYNNRHQPTSISYDLAGVHAGQYVAPTAGVTVGYDAAGNRTSMTDGLGSVTYSYNQLSRLEWEARTFTGLAGPNGGAYRLSYEYNLAGQVTRVTNPWGAQVSYEHDANGRTAAVTGAGQASPATYASNIQYRAFGGLKRLDYGNTKTLAVGYDSRMRMNSWNVPSVLGYEYHYDNSQDAALWLSDKAHRVVYAKNVSSGGTAAGGGRDASLDRSFDYDHVGRLQYAHSGVEARMHAYNQAHDGGSYGPYAQHHGYDVWGNLNYRAGWGGANPSYTASYAGNRRAGLTYDLSGNVTHDGGQEFAYDATGQQVSASGAGLQQWYDGDTLRAKKVENGYATYYLRSSALGKVVAEIDGGGGWHRGYVYAGAQLLAVQEGGGARWAHQDPVVKSQRMTDASGNVTAGIELDPWGGDTNRSWQQHQQPQRYTSYQRDANESDEAVMRRYNRWWARFDQPDPYDGSYDLTDPQSLNRYSYTQNDPVNFTDPTGLQMVTGQICTWVAMFEINSNGSVGRQVSGEYLRCRSAVFYVPDEPSPEGVGGVGPQSPAFDTDGIRKGLQDALKNPDCANFVKDMLNAVATKGNPLYKGGDIMALFESLLSQTQGGYTRTAPAGSAGYGNAMGLISKGDASIYLYGDANTASLQTIHDTKGTLHELMHLAGSKARYTDRAFVDAVRGNPAYANLSRAPYPGDKNYKFREQAKNPNFGGWSSYWGDVLNQKCFGGR